MLALVVQLIKKILHVVVNLLQTVKISPNSRLLFQICLKLIWILLFILIIIRIRLKTWIIVLSCKISLLKVIDMEGKNGCLHRNNPLIVKTIKIINLYSWDLVVSRKKLLNLSEWPIQMKFYYARAVQVTVKCVTKHIYHQNWT